MNYTALNDARAKVAVAREAIAKDDEALQEIENQVAVLQARIETLKQRQEEKGLRVQLAAAERELGEVEEATLDQINLELAGAIVRRQALDPLRHYPWIMTSLLRLRDSTRTEFNTPITQRYAVHPLITQALALLPRRDGVNQPVWELGHEMHGYTDWASRRRAIIASAEADATPPLEAA
jgi:hypothetical protein